MNIKFYDPGEWELYEEIATAIKKYNDAGAGYDFDIDTIDIHMIYPSANGGTVYGFSTRRPNSLYDGSYTYDNYMVRLNDDEGDMVARLFISESPDWAREMFKVLRTDPYKIIPPLTIPKIFTTPEHDENNPSGKATSDTYQSSYAIDLEDDSWELQFVQQVKDGKLTNPIE